MRAFYSGRSGANPNGTEEQKSDAEKGQYDFAFANQTHMLTSLCCTW
jgi:hypothetical protein